MSRSYAKSYGTISVPDVSSLINIGTTLALLYAICNLQLNYVCSWTKSLKNCWCRHNEILFWNTRYIFILAEGIFYNTSYIWKRVRKESTVSDSYNVSHVQLSDHRRADQAPMWSCESAKILNSG